MAVLPPRQILTSKEIPNAKLYDHLLRPQEEDLEHLQLRRPKR